MASKRRLRRKCEGKRSYLDVGAALDALAEHRARGDFGLHAYRCPFGLHWHVGHLPGAVRRAIERREEAYP